MAPVLYNGKDVENRLVVWKVDGTYGIPPMYQCWKSSNPETSCKLSRGVTGRVVQFNSSSKHFEIAVPTLGPYAYFVVHEADINVTDRVYGQWTVKQANPGFAPIQGFAGESGAVGRGRFGLFAREYLAGLNGERRIPDIDVYRKRYLQDDTHIHRTAQYYITAIQAASPKAIDILDKSDFTIHELTKACQKFASSDIATPSNKYGFLPTVNASVAGIYLILYYDKRSGKWYLYVGQSVDIANRLRDHRKSYNDDQNDLYDTDHYKAARDATTWAAFIFCTHKRDEGGNDIEGFTLRNIYEQITIAALSTYAPKVLHSSSLIGQDRNIGNWESHLAEATILAMADRKEIGLIHIQLAREAANRIGYALPSELGRKDFGISAGLNVSSPCGCESVQRYERIVWSVMWFPHLGRFVFTRPSYIARNEQHANSFCIWYQGTDVEIQAPNDPQGPKGGDEVWWAWEIVARNRGAHPVPAFAMGKLSVFQAKEHIERLGLRQYWRPQDSANVRSRYVQEGTAGIRFIAHHRDASKRFGALRPFVKGAAILAYFQHWSWPDDMDFVPDLGKARIFGLQLDYAAQEATITPWTPTEEVPGDIIWRDGAAWLMKSIRAPGPPGAPQLEQLENINLWLRDQIYFCDYCAISPAGDRPAQCVEQQKPKNENSNETEGMGICERCYQRGICCSWTRPEWLNPGSAFRQTVMDQFYGSPPQRQKIYNLGPVNFVKAAHDVATGA